MTAPTKQQKIRWDKIASLGCIICASPACIHHALTGAGGRKNHDIVLPLCHFHHQGAQGIHTLGRKAWAKIYGTEQQLLEKLEGML
jgi:hypothetical protein